MENQHRKINGYRDLTQSEINLMNYIKELGSELGSLVTELQSVQGLDQRAIEIGKTELQSGLMWLIRGAAQPDSF